MSRIVESSLNAIAWRDAAGLVGAANEFHRRRLLRRDRRTGRPGRSGTKKKTDRWKSVNKIRSGRMTHLERSRSPRAMGSLDPTLFA